MKQERQKKQKTLPTPLRSEELQSIKGGYREMPGIDAGSLSVRWDEIDIRFDDGVGNFLTGGPQGSNRQLGSHLGISKKRP